MTFKDDLREVLDSLEPDGKRINGTDQALSAITKLVERLIGEVELLKIANSNYYNGGKTIQRSNSSLIAFQKGLDVCAKAIAQEIRERLR